MGGLLAVALALPLASYRANRIAPAEPRGLFEALPLSWALAVVGLALAAVAVALAARRPALRLAVSALMLLALLMAIGEAGRTLSAGGAQYARVAPGVGFWLAAFALAILVTDAIVRLRPGPLGRLAALAAALAALGLILVSGQWDGLSVLAEYRGRAAAFWREGGHHLQLAFGSLAVAVAAGVPLGIAIHRARRFKAPVLNGLSLLQTIPSIALFGILIVPLGWVAANVPGAAALGVQGIGMAPAFVALFIYSLLPMVANTAAGLAAVPAGVTEAAAGMGLTRRQQLASVELPLALPVILTGIRIVLVQNIGLATIAALIGGGGFGTFVFQGLGQTATDLILLGALPTVALAFVAAVVLDATVDLLPGARR
ncbi:ABC transporter permease [Aquibium sp. A9E412]|uniref:ABC transporter permease n=1 Tax=Aquibium sp. A9E412 TaxID=2976767 RepID=UPI0025B21BD5|nr:ABC transporter permease [Aquibium sp. A9E412]MDN2566706.1 ABC transporter permease [Aquibium sp. A9E412]